MPKQKSAHDIIVDEIADYIIKRYIRPVAIVLMVIAAGLWLYIFLG